MSFEKEIFQILKQQQKAIVLLGDQISEISITADLGKLVQKLAPLKKRLSNHEQTAQQLMAQLEMDLTTSIPPVKIIDSRPVRDSIRIAKEYPIRSVIGVLVLIAVILHREIPEWLKLLW